MCDFVGKTSLTSPLSLSQLPKSLAVLTRQHLHLLRTDVCMQWRPWIQMGKKQYSNMRQEFTLGKCYIVCPLYTLLAVLKVFLIHLFPFSPLLHSDQTFSLGYKKILWLKPWRASRSFHLIRTHVFFYQVLAWRIAVVERADVWTWLGALAIWKIPSLRCVIGTLPIRLPVEWFPSLHMVWSPVSRWVLSCTRFAPLLLQYIQCDLCLTATALSLYRSTYYDSVKKNMNLGIV